MDTKAKRFSMLSWGLSTVCLVVADGSIDFIDRATWLGFYGGNEFTGVDPLDLDPEQCVTANQMPQACSTNQTPQDITRNRTAQAVTVNGGCNV